VVQLNWNEITAIFGGAFDPPHLGHREAMDGLFKNPGVKDVRILPTGKTALKTAQTPARHRLAMAKLAFPNFTVDDREVRHAESGRALPTYSFDSIMELSRELGSRIGEDSKLAFVIGIDQLENLNRWYRFPEVLGLCHWIVLERAFESRNHSATRLEKGLRNLENGGSLVGNGSPKEFRTRTPSGAQTAFITVETPARAISSTEIRKILSGLGEMPPEERYLAPDVESYLKAHRLYGS
jgi:nicotinate-nucleotide adenylyltransferase